MICTCKWFVNISNHKHGTLNLKNTFITSRYFYELFYFSNFIITFATVMLILILQVMPWLAFFLGIRFLTDNSFIYIMTSIVPIFSMYHTNMFYLAHINFILLISIFVNFRFSSTVFLLIYILRIILIFLIAICSWQIY